MNEILIRKYIKQVMRYGVPSRIAKEIVGIAYTTCKGKDIDKYIDYAMTLVYGLKIN